MGREDAAGLSQAPAANLICVVHSQTEKGTLAAERRAGRPEQKVSVTLFHKGWARAGREPATAAQNTEPAGWELGKEKDPEPSFYLETRCKLS